jgi:hypothetical protein
MIICNVSMMEASMEFNVLFILNSRQKCREQVKRFICKYSNSLTLSEAEI